jgi:diadenosine tetraphosphate (Ap4A) HIT family hydrolase
MSNCPFCTLDPKRIIDLNEFGVAIRDGFPVSNGHTLIIPKRHIASFFDITHERPAEIGFVSVFLFYPKRKN